MSELRVYVPPYDGFDRDGYPVAWQEIKHEVRERAGHRCVRCSHPYRTGESRPDWSPCDEHCTHPGPVRFRLAGSTEWGYLGADEFSGSWNDIGIKLVGQRETGVYEVEAERRVLTTHHLTGDKADCRWWNLAALCQRCHLTIQGKVVMDRAWPHEHSGWFKPYAAGWYAFFILGEEIDREEAEARMDELLALEHRQLGLAPFADGRA